MKLPILQVDFSICAVSIDQRTNYTRSIIKIFVAAGGNKLFQNFYKPGVVESLKKLLVFLNLQTFDLHQKQAVNCILDANDCL